MSSIKCDKCNSLFKRKQGLAAHLRRKVPCDVPYELHIELWVIIASTSINTYNVLVRVIKGLDKTFPYGVKNWKEWFTIGKIDADGNERWCLRNLLHRERDLPAKIHHAYHGQLGSTSVHVLGSQEWYQHGKLHRDNDKSAVVHSNGDQEWWMNGIQYRERDKPTVIRASGGQEWYMNGKRHRGDDKPAVIYPNGTQEWWLNGERHREGNKPAIIRADGGKSWWILGKKNGVR